MSRATPPPRDPRSIFPAVRTIGLERRPFEDVYHQILTRPWRHFVGVIAVLFVVLNVVFALLYLAQAGSIANAREGSFEDAFYFSVQTMATIGYGGMTPATRYAHLVVMIEAITGILTVAVITGVTFAKFARPTARVMFSAQIAAPTRFGVPHLQFRMANQRNNLVAEATLRVLVLVKQTTPEGEVVRMPIDLPLVRDRTALFTLTWTAMHKIDEKSPFHGEGALERLQAQGAEIFLTFNGLDETFAQNIHARHRYRLEDIAWGCRFADVLTVEPDGTRVVDYSHFDEVVPVEVKAEEAARAG